MAISRSYVKLGTVSSSEQSTKGIVRKVVAKLVHPYYSISEQINPGAHFDIAVLQVIVSYYKANFDSLIRKRFLFFSCPPSNETVRHIVAKWPLYKILVKIWVFIQM